MYAIKGSMNILSLRIALSRGYKCNVISTLEDVCFIGSM